MDRGRKRDAGVRALQSQRQSLRHACPRRATRGPPAAGGSRCEPADHPGVRHEGTMRSRLLAFTVVAGLLLVTGSSDGGPIYRFVDEAGGVVVFTDNPWQFEIYRRQLNEDAERNPGATSSDSSSEKAAWPRDEGARPPRVSSMAQEVIHLAGLDAQVQGLAAIAQSEIDQLSWRFRWSGPVRTRLAKTFDPETLRQGMSRSLTRRLDPVRTAVLLSWLRSPLSKRIVALETASTTAARAADMTQFINQLPSSPLRPSRLALMHRISRASQAAESTAVVMAATATAIRRAPPAASTTADVAIMQDKPDPTVDEMLRFRTMTALLYTYKDVRDDELGRYAQFLESPVGRWFTRISRDALLDSLTPQQPEPRPGRLIRSAQR